VGFRVLGPLGFRHRGSTLNRLRHYVQKYPSIDLCARFVRLRLLPSRALSFTPAACSVSVLVVACNCEMKKGLIIAALSDMLHNGSLPASYKAGQCPNRGLRKT